MHIYASYWIFIDCEYYSCLHFPHGLTRVPDGFEREGLGFIVPRSMLTFLHLEERSLCWPGVVTVVCLTVQRPFPGGGMFGFPDVWWAPRLRSCDLWKHKVPLRSLCTHYASEVRNSGYLNVNLGNWNARSAVIWAINVCFLRVWTLSL